MRSTLAARFWAKVSRMGDGCWEWTARRDKDGYGEFQIDGKKDRAHRVSWRLHFGEIPPGHLVCHTCDNPPCINPAHLFLGTNTANIRDASAKGRLAKQHTTHCPQGHEYTPGNTRIYRSRKGWVMRLCCECNRASCKRRYAQNRANGVARSREWVMRQRASDPEGFRMRQRDYMRAHRARKREAATHLQPPEQPIPQSDRPLPQ